VIKEISKNIIVYMFYTIFDLVIRSSKKKYGGDGGN